MNLLVCIHHRMRLIFVFRATYDPSVNIYDVICNVIEGITDEVYQSHSIKIVHTISVCMLANDIPGIGIFQSSKKLRK